MADVDVVPIEEDDDMPELIETGKNPTTSTSALKSVNKDTSVAEVEEGKDDFQQVKRSGRKRKGADEGMDVDPQITAVNNSKKKKLDGELRKVPVPSNRYSPLKEHWMKLFTPVVEHLKLQIRFNLKTRNVEIRSTKKTDDISNLQKAADFVSAFVLGFSVEDALALVRLDDLFVESFEINDVKPLKGEHLSRAIGRIAGKDGRTKFTIENITKTRIVLADSKIHLLGSFQNIKIARNAICNLILGSPPSKVYGNLRRIASRAVESF